MANTNVQELVLITSTDVIIQCKNGTYRADIDTFKEDYEDIFNKEFPITTYVDYNKYANQYVASNQEGNTWLEDYPNRDLEELLTYWDAFNDKDAKRLGEALASRMLGKNKTISVKSAKADPESFVEAKEAKILAFKERRLEEELQPVIHKGHAYQFDVDSERRLNAALRYMQNTGTTGIEWADVNNDIVTLNQDDIIAISNTAFERIQALRAKYVMLKEEAKKTRSYKQLKLVEW